MKALIKKILLFTLLFVYILLGLVLNFATLILPQLRFRIISKLTKALSILLRSILEIKITVKGNTQCIKEKGNFIIANHQGYLDGVILASIFPVVFVSKLQVKSWPVFGWLNQIGGTIFIDRKNKLKVPSSVKEISRMLQNKVNVLIFPEGTSTDGTRILPFQSIFFQAPLDVRSGIIPITIQYTKINSQNVSKLNRDRVCWYGQNKIFQHMPGILALDSIEVELTIHPKIVPPPDISTPDLRKEISITAHQIISQVFTFIN
jgi:1-acyl-sn-glycerol-3-phosphate acyltransferase